MKVSLKEIIGQFLNSSDQSSHQFVRLWNIGVFGIKTEFNLDITGVYRTQVLDINPNNTVDLPCDYIKYSKIGVINGQGEVVTFKRNNQLSTLNLGSKNRFTGAPVVGGNNTLIYPYNNHYHNFYDSGTMWNLYGADSGTATIAEYKVDESQNLIFLSPNSTQSQIVLEYLCDGFYGDCGICDVDVRAATCMMAYLRWQNAIDAKKKFGINEVQVLMKEFYRTKRLAKMRLNPVVLNEMQAAFRQSIKLVAKA